ncbi:microfibril-associated glycoprotein 4-like [Clytia hemisphaerica]|uniref:Fibrinogen C-terminal domain-containing protein n=1 Tax=Clytia hemisphaerica TaxID=252671 RepID=A0A7M5XBH3_9CNID
MEMIQQKVIIFATFIHLIIAGKTFNNFGQQVPQETPFNIVDVHHGQQRCFSICTYSQRCMAFLIKTKPDGSGGFICQFYDRSVRMLNMAISSVTGVTFYSIYVNLNSCADYYKAGYRKNDLYEVKFSNGTMEHAQCYLEYKDCWDWQHNHQHGDVYVTREIALPSRLVKVRCFGSWTLLQKRTKAGGTVDFQRTWQEYKQGFGKMEENEFWLGNQIIHEMTNRGIGYKIYIWAKNFNGAKGHASYTNFRVGPESDSYRLECATAPTFGQNALYNGNRFTTFDRDNDQFQSGNCAAYQDLSGGFWYSSCGGFYPNGQYIPYKDPSKINGIVWNAWINKQENLQNMEIRIDRMS